MLYVLLHTHTTYTTFLSKKHIPIGVFFFFFPLAKNQQYVKEENKEMSG